MEIQLRKSAVKDLSLLDKRTEGKVRAAIQSLENFPKVRNVKKLVHFEPAFRIRIGKIRILFDVQENTIFIARILQRKEAYR
jgi:mRNA interferase RelE/StbE